MKRRNPGIPRHAGEVVWNPTSAAGIRTVRLRFGVILSRHGGALGRLLPVFRLVRGEPPVMVEPLGGAAARGRPWWARLSSRNR